MIAHLLIIATCYCLWTLDLPPSADPPRHKSLSRVVKITNCDGRESEVQMAMAIDNNCAMWKWWTSGLPAAGMECCREEDVARHRIGTVCTI